ncbi:MAG: lytic transglycosylase domain-containing protein [Sphingomonadaceae bacterium]|nr:lytic transglycosylase domain-containing protein [Sphingomonadaceae bacterium]
MVTSPASAPAAPRGQVRTAIANAAARTGVDFDYLLAQARLESGLNPNARARTSSASGLYQFIGSTWLETLDRHAEKHGLGWAGEAIDMVRGRAVVDDASTRSSLMRLRFDPGVSALMAAELASDNAAELQPILGRAPDAGELYLAHFLGAQGAKRFLAGLQDDADQSAAALFPKPAAANRAIFYDGGRPRSLGEVMGLLRGKVAAAMGKDGTVPDFAPVTPVAFPHPTRFAQATPPRRAALPSLPSITSGPSMAETLQATFGGALPATAAERIGAAYGKFRAFDL